MKVFRSILIVTLAGLVGLVLIYTDRIPVPLGWSRVAFGVVFYAAAGFLLVRWNAGKRALGWVLAAGWGPAVLGAVGLSEVLVDPGRSDPLLATLFLLGPALSALVGGRLALVTGSRQPDPRTSD